MDTFTPQSYVEHSFLIYYMNNKNQVEKNTEKYRDKYDYIQCSQITCMYKYHSQVWRNYA